MVFVRCIIVGLLHLGLAAGEEASHWAFVPPHSPALLETSGADVASHPIDRLVVARLRDEGLQLAPSVDRRVLLRRLSFDLTGLPPTYEATRAFVADTRPDAVERVVDRLLAAPQFGERWARHWLDLARYADTKGYVFTAARDYTHAYTYRDWVVAAFNRDLPYDEFIRLQLAADRLGQEQDLPAMGFLTLGRRFLNNQHDIIDDRIDVVTRGLMGLTVSCARCHDHKYDPIPTADYYALYGVFASSEEPGDEPGPLRLVDKAKPTDAPILRRGNPGSRGDRVPRRFLTALSDGQPVPFAQGSGRAELAEKIAAADNPLTARVWVNRIWQHLLGRGLVDTPSDFGARSTRPEHQAVLDWLAVELVQRGWSTKAVVREIVLSKVYQQSAEASAAAYAADPENRWFSRGTRRRLDLEALRDAVLFVSGELDATLGGPAVELLKDPYPPRRTLYGKIERQNLPAFYRTFDFASPDAHAPRRYETTVPLQALFLMNHPFLGQQAAALARRSENYLATQESTEAPTDQPIDQPTEEILSEEKSDEVSDETWITQAYRFALARDPGAEELAAMSSFLESGATRPQAAQALLMCNEFYFLD